MFSLQKNLLLLGLQLLLGSEVSGRRGGSHSYSRLLYARSTDHLKLENGRSLCSGLLKVITQTSLVPVCEQVFHLQDASVACRELDCGLAKEFSPKAGGQHAQWSPAFWCEGKEKKLLDCRSAPIKGSVANCSTTSLSCTGRPSSPSVSCHSLDEQLSSDLQATRGQRFAISCSHHSSHFFHHKLRSMRLTAPDGSLRVQPVDNGSTVFMFPAATDAHTGTYECDYELDEDTVSHSETFSLGLKEADALQLVLDGGLELQHQDLWRAVSSWRSWSLKEASVACRQMKLGAAVVTRSERPHHVPLEVWRFYSDCSGSEGVLMDCGLVRKERSYSSVQVICSDVLLQPNISYSSMVDIGDQTMNNSLLSGHKFSILCSVVPQFSGGSFSLVFVGSNINFTLNQTAANHTASFHFPAAGHAHQGTYRCVYSVTALDHELSSESESLTLSVRDGLLLVDGTTCSGELRLLSGGEPMPFSADWSVWGLSHAHMVCRQLGCGAAVATGAVHHAHAVSALRLFSDCRGSEETLMECRAARPWFSSSTITVNCTVSRPDSRCDRSTNI